MPSLFLPVTVAEHLSSSYPLPELFRQYGLHGAAGAHFRTDALTAFVQSLTINGFTVGLHLLQVQQPALLRFITTKESAMLHYVLAGSMQIHQPDGTALLQYDNQHYGLGFHPGGSEQLLYFEPGEYRYFQLSFSLNLMQHLLPFFPPPTVHPVTGYPLFTLSLPIQKRVNATIHQLLLQASYKQPDILQLNTLALQLTARFLYDYRQTETRLRWEAKKEIQFAELEAYIQDYLDTDNRRRLSLTVLARKTGTSLYHFKQLFKQQYGYAPAALIHRKRMERAMQLITSSSLPAGDMYQQVGYENFSSFSRAFTQYYGHPPSYYRQP